MPHTVFTDYQPPAIPAAWLNEVDEYIFGNTSPASNPGATALDLRNDLSNGAGIATGAKMVAFGSRTVDAKLRDTVSIVDKGGIPGSGDSTAAYQACLDLGYVDIIIPAGMTFYVGQHVYKTGNRVKGGGTLKVLADSGLPSGVTYWGDSSAATDVEITEVTLDGNRGNLSGSAGWKHRALLVREGLKVNFHPRYVLNFQDGGIECTASTQANPTDSHTPPADPSDSVYLTLIHDFIAINCGRFEDDGHGDGTSDSKVVQIGSTTRGVHAWNIISENCPGGVVLAAAYNRDLMINNIRSWNTGAARTYASTMVAVEQLSQGCTVSDIYGRGFRTLLNIESALGGVIGLFYGEDVYNGVSIFASNIGATATDVGELTILGGFLKGRGTTSGTFGFRCVLSSGNAAYDAIIGIVQAKDFHEGHQIEGVQGGSAGFLYAKNCVTGIIVGNCKNFHLLGFHANACSAEGFFAGAGNDTVTVQAGKSEGCAYGGYIDDGQVSLRLRNSDFDGANTTADLHIENPNANAVEWTDVQFRTHSGAFKTISGATPDVTFSGDVVLLGNGGATTMTDLTGGRIGKRVELVDPNGNTTITHGTKFFLKAGANRTMGAHSGISLRMAESGKWAEV